MAGALTAMVASIFSGGVTADPHYEYTTLLLPGNGTNGAQNNTFLDASTNNFTLARNGNTTQGTFSPFSQTGWGNYFGGSGNYLSVTGDCLPSSTGDYTVEAWINLGNVTAAATKIITSGNTSGSFLFRVGQSFLGNVNGLSISRSAVADDNYCSYTFAVNTWYHVAVVRSSGTVYFFVNGQQQTTLGSGGGTANYTTTSTGYIGQQGTSTSEPFVGYISNIRTTSGALYTSNFTPSTTPLNRTVSAGTVKLLTCQSNRFLDSNGPNTPATSPLTITATGSPSVQAFSPFNPTASWSAATYGGSGYFDGNGDYLSSTATFMSIGTNPYTIEFWIYPTSLSATVSHLVAANATNGLVVYATNAKVALNKYGTGDIFAYNTSLIVSAWSHVAVVREGTGSNQTKIYVNGSVAATGTDSTNWTTTTNTAIGGNSSGAGSQFFFGYLSGCRIVNGTAVYTGAFTPPTEPLTAITNTSLLLNFTNAGIYDATSKNDLETLDNTVNGVRISTAQSQFGGSSILFDGTGTDYLWIQADQPIQRFGTGKFTIELWIRLAATGSARGLVAKGTSTTGWLVSLNTSNQVVFTYGTSTITSTGTISASVWTYIAVVREGTGTNQTKIYINGTNDGTGTVNTDFNQTNAMYLGANRTGGDLFSGYMQDVRITNGIARTITSTPTAAFPTL